MRRGGWGQTGKPGWRFAGFGGWGVDEEHGVKIPEGWRECHGQCSKRGVRGKLFFCCKKEVHAGIQGPVHQVRMFISLLPQRTEPKKVPPCPLSRRWRDALRSSMLPGLCKLAALKQCKSPFRQPLRCSAACQWDFPPLPICPAAPRRRGRKRRGNCLRAKPEFFRVPPSLRSKGSPQGQDWLGCLFLVSSFGHAKEERKHSRKVITIFPGIFG